MSSAFIADSRVEKLLEASDLENALALTKSSVTGYSRIYYLFFIHTLKYNFLESVKWYKQLNKTDRSKFYISLVKLTYKKIMYVFPIVLVCHFCS